MMRENARRRAGDERPKGVKTRIGAALALAVGLALAAALLAPASGGAQAGEEPYDPFFAQPQTVAGFGDTSRPFGIAAGDYDSDGELDLVVGRVTGQVAFVRGTGDGEFAAPQDYSWRAGFFNAWAFAPADVDGDGNLDVVWGANASISGGAQDGEVRVWFGNGDGTFDSTGFFNAGALLADVGTDAGSVAAGDVDGDDDVDVVAGAVDGSDSVVRLLRNDGSGAFAVETLISQPTGTSPGDPVYFPATSTQNSPWGLSLSDADGDGDLDLWAGDRALYVYLFENDGSGALELRAPNEGVPATRTNAYLDHDAFRAEVGFTPSLGSGDVNGDGSADLAVGLHSGTQSPASDTPNDGRALLDVSAGGAHSGFGPLADLGTMARGVTVADADGDGFNDVIAGTYEGEVKMLRQLEPVDTDGDGISDYVDNAPEHPNAPRIDMNTDGTINHQDQLDNDFDTVRGDPEDPSTWERLGDVVDPDDDNDGVPDADDNCRFVANAGQADADSDGRGDACDPLDHGDRDSDGVPDGPVAGDSRFADARDAKRAWASGETRFVIRIDALSRLFQNEFTQLMTDAATLSEEEWQGKCWENYGPGGGDPPDPCGPVEGGDVTLSGGKEVPISLVVIPRLLWTDEPVIDWVDDRNDSPRLEIAQHGTYHFNNTPLGDWADLPDRDFFSCETCGLTEAEAFELLKVGYDTLLGDYENKWVRESGARDSDAKIDWSQSARPLSGYSPPFNASDTTGRDAVSQLSFIGFTASEFEERSPIFTPEGSHHEQFDQFGMYHASADVELEPPETENGAYDAAEYEEYLESETDEGGLTTWLIEEVEWSGRPCNDQDRFEPCNGDSNRENNTVYEPRWQGWMQVLDFVRDYPGGVALTMDEVALAQAYDNAPTVANPDQADADADAIGDAIDGARFELDDATLRRNAEGTLSARLTNGEGEPIADQEVELSFDADGDGTTEAHAATTDADGVAEVAVTPTRPVGDSTYSVAWDGVRETAQGEADVLVRDATGLNLADAVAVRDEQAVARARLTDSDGEPVAGRTIRFLVEGNHGLEPLGSAETGANGVAEVTVPRRYTTGRERLLRAEFDGDRVYLASDDEATAFRRRGPSAPRSG